MNVEQAKKALDAAEVAKSVVQSRSTFDVVEALKATKARTTGFDYVSQIVDADNPIGRAILNGQKFSIQDALRKISPVHDLLYGQKNNGLFSAIAAIREISESPMLKMAREQKAYLNGIKSAAAIVSGQHLAAKGAWSAVQALNAGQFLNISAIKSQIDAVLRAEGVLGSYSDKTRHFDLLRGQVLTASEVEKTQAIENGHDETSFSPSQIILLENVTRVQSLIKKVVADNDELFNLQPRDFERSIAELCRGEGLKVELTAQTRDGGRDIIAIKDIGISQLRFLIECKRHRHDRPVTIQIVRGFHSVLITDKAHKGMICTSSYFTREAQQFQEKHLPVLLDLRDGKQIIRWMNMYVRQQKLL